MFLNLFHGLAVSKKLNKLSESLKKDFGVDLDIYNELTSAELAEFAQDLEYKKAKIISESDFNSYYNDPEYTRTTLLLEAVRIILTEIHPKRAMKRKFQENYSDVVHFSVDGEQAYEDVMVRYGNEIDYHRDHLVIPSHLWGKIQEICAENNGFCQEVHMNETLDYKIHPSTSVAVDHDIDEDKERPDLYWRRHQWEEERTHENHPVTVHDADEVEYGENPDNTNRTIPSYAANAQPVGGTAENEQQAGIYVAVMDPNRFLGDEDTKIMSIEPTVKSQNETSPLTRKVSDVMVDAEAPVEGTQFEIAGNKDAALQGKSPKKVIAVYEKDDDTNEEGKKEMKEKNELAGLVEGLGTLLEGELERAELVLATRDLVARLQKMIEDLGKMGTDDIMPLVDGLRQNFGPNVAENFSAKAEQHIQNAADAVQDMKDTLEDESERLEGRISDEDAEKPMNDMAMGMGGDEMRLGGDELGGDELGGDELGGDELGGDELGMEPAGEEDLGDLLGGDEAAASKEPLGRAKKESHVVTIAGKKVRLSENQLRSLMQAMKISKKVNALIEAENNKPKTVDIMISGLRFRLNENQVKALIFAKNFNRLVESKQAKVARLSETQALMLKMAKNLTEKVRALIEAKKGKKPDADGDGVPDWADKKPGKDDKAGKKKKKGGKPKKGVVPPQFKKKSKKKTNESKYSKEQLSKYSKAQLDHMSSLPDSPDYDKYFPDKKKAKKKTKEAKVSNSTKLKERARVAK